MTAVPINMVECVLVCFYLLHRIFHVNNGSATQAKRAFSTTEGILWKGQDVYCLSYYITGSFSLFVKLYWWLIFFQACHGQRNYPYFGLYQGLAAMGLDLVSFLSPFSKQALNLTLFVHPMANQIKSYYFILSRKMLWCGTSSAKQDNFPRRPLHTSVSTVQQHSDFSRFRHLQSAVGAKTLCTL